MPSVVVVKEAFRSMRVSMGGTSRAVGDGATYEGLQAAHGEWTATAHGAYPHFSLTTLPHTHSERTSATLFLLPLSTRAPN